MMRPAAVLLPPGPSAPDDLTPSSAQQGAGVGSRPASPSRARAALASAAAAINIRSLEAQKALLESQLEAARRAQRTAEDRVSGGDTPLGNRW